jgi:hypothetical protein
MSDHVLSEAPDPIAHLLEVARDHDLPLRLGVPERRPERARAASEAERARLGAVTVVRERAQAAGWPGPYRVQVPARTSEIALGLNDKWVTWLDLPNSHDRLGTAIARCKALVHGLPDDVPHRWYGDQRRALGTHETARVVDGQGTVVHEERRA